MKLCLITILLFATIGAQPSQAQDVFPPHASRVLQGTQGVLLSWPGSSSSKYLLQLTTGSVMVAEREVLGNRISLPLRPGLGYQWKVHLITASGFQPVGAVSTFQVVTESEVTLQGSDGKNGKQGTRASRYRGEDGSAGKPGPALTATLSRIGEGYVGLTLTGAPANREYLFAPGAGPLVISSRGGDGGPGGPGYDGRDGEVLLGTGAVSLAEPGGDGGNGGPGGDGGSITVISNGLEVGRYLEFDIRGGAGGLAGPAGLGGRPPLVSPQLQYRYGYALQPAPPGVPGQPGRPGRDGQILLR